jgi:cell fate (sporulation/competence/biofilm development) regulator YlbF (YheA/YmcA/DUF963 family)
MQVETLPVHPDLTEIQSPEPKNIWMIARELAEAIEESPELLRYRETEDTVLQDEEAIQLIRTYEAAKRAVKKSKTKPAEEQIALVNRFMEVEEQFNTHEVIQAYWTARVTLDSLLEKVNHVVTYPITGTEAPKTGGGCSSGSGGSCSTGGGCGCS